MSLPKRPPRSFLFLLTLASLIALQLSVRFTEASAQDDCAEAVDLRVLLSRDLTTIAFPRIPLTVSGTKSALIKHTCPNGNRLEKPLPSFAWTLEKPAGSASSL